MLQAHAMVPEGAGGGSIYKRPKADGPPVPDPSYTLPASTPLPPGAAAAAATAVAGGGAPISGSDMQLTGGDEAPGPQQQHAAVQAEPGLEEEPQLQQEEQRRQSLQPLRRQSLQPAAGRMAHAAAGAALRPASAESQMQQPAAAGRPRRQSVALANTAAVGATGGSRRVSAPPAVTEWELRFSSSSVAAGLPAQQLHPLALAAVPEEEGVEGAGAAGQPASQATAPGPLVRVTLAAGSPVSVPAPPRDAALAKLTGLVATPLKGGIYQYSDPRFGYVFQLGPASPDSAGARLGGRLGCVWQRV